MAKKNELSNLHCDKAKPKGKPYRLADGGGLYLLVTPTGGKLWQWRYRYEEKEKLMALGKYPDVPLVRARLLHAQARALLAAGTDPMTERKEAKQEKLAALAEEEQKTASRDTVEALARQWFNWWKTDKNQRYVANVETRLENDVIAPIGLRAAADVTRKDVVALVMAIDQRGARDIARRTVQLMSQIYNFGCNRGLLEINPAAAIRPRDILSKTVEKNFARIPIDELPNLLRRMRHYDGTAVTRYAMELLALTFLRTSELIGASWSEIDWEQNLWRIPKERMKGKRGGDGPTVRIPHLVPLSRQARQALEHLRETNRQQLIFPAPYGGTGPINKNTILKALERMGYKGHMTGHGWRAIASTYLNENGYDHEHVEIQLAHTKADKMAGTYNYALYLEPRRKMMQHWADFLDQCREAKTAKTRNVA
jgi:integrase